MKGFLSRLKPKKQDQGASGATPAEASSPEAEGSAVGSGQKPAEQGSSQKIVLELGDLLNRIPAHLLKEGAHDASQRIFFKMSDLSSNLAEGKATIPLSSIASRCPEIFRKEIGPEDDVEIFFPWSKLLERVRNYKAMVDQPQGEKNPAMHYKSQTHAIPAIRFRQQAASLVPAPKPAVETPAPAAEKTEAAPASAAPATPAPEASLTSTTPMAPIASRRLKQNWFQAAPPPSHNYPPSPPKAWPRRRATISRRFPAPSCRRKSPLRKNPRSPGPPIKRRLPPCRKHCPLPLKNRSLRPPGASRSPPGRPRRKIAWRRLRGNARTFSRKNPKSPQSLRGRRRSTRNWSSSSPATAKPPSTRTTGPCSNWRSCGPITKRSCTRCATSTRNN